MLLTHRDSLIKLIYRKPFDFFERKTTLMADKILVNSNFTKGIVQDCFMKLSISRQLQVLYPAVGNDFLKLLNPISKSNRR